MKAPLFILFFSLLTFNVSAQITVNSSGNVGVRTSSPLSALHVNGSLSLSDQRVSSVDANYIYYGDMMGGDGLRGLALRAGDQNRMYITTDGNVGIGTSDPQATLDIWKHYSSGTDSLRFSYNDSGYAYWMGIQAYVVGTGNVGYKFRTNNINTTVDAMAITGAGRVGIGTTSPAAKLTIVASSTVDPLQLKDSTGGSFRLGPSVGASGGFQFYDDVAAATRLRIDSSGNIGVGTNSPAEKFHVSGKVRATSFISDVGPSGYADFVFDEDYQLAPLSEVEAHIEEHGHLPDIPSEAEAMANGIDLAAMQVRLLQKVEELTLHVIELDKKNRRLEKTIAELKSN